MERHINCELYILRDQYFPTETEVKQIHFLLQWKMPQDRLGPCTLASFINLESFSNKFCICQQILEFRFLLRLFLCVFHFFLVTNFFRTGFIFSIWLVVLFHFINSTFVACRSLQFIPQIVLFQFSFHLLLSDNKAMLYYALKCLYSVIFYHLLVPYQAICHVTYN